MLVREAARKDGGGRGRGPAAGGTRGAEVARMAFRERKPSDRCRISAQRINAQNNDVWVGHVSLGALHRITDCSSVNSLLSYSSMKWLKILLASSFLLSLAGIIFVASLMQSLYLRQADAEADAIVFAIASGESVDQISASLEESGLIRNRFLFKTYAWLVGKETKFKAGVYELQPGTSISFLVKTLTGTGTGLEVSVTIPEGYTASQIGVLVETKLAVSAEDWAAASAGLEGYLFPDTYRFVIGTTAQEVISTLRENFDRRLEEFAVEIGTIENLEELIILASIIEREVQSEQDMALVSDIFRKRLEVGMALQADSTVNYVTGNDTPAISLEDRDIDSPYNTYKYAGLPPGPISNPGIASIIAANNPQANDYWYFLTTPEGEVIYAETFEEHVENKMLYLY